MSVRLGCRSLIVSSSVRRALSLVVEQGGDADTTMVIHDLRGQVSRARERAEILEERLDETVRRNRRLELEVAEAMEIGVRGSSPLCFFLYTRAVTASP